MKRLWSWGWVVLGTIGVTLGAVLIAQAAIPDAQGVIHGCYMNNNGNLRVVDDASSCKNNETAISWSQQGPEGQPGPTGATGPTGPEGPAGNSTDAYHSKGPQAIPAAANEITGLRNIPAGVYLVWASVVATNDNSLLGSTCSIGVNGAFVTVPVGSTLIKSEDGLGLRGSSMIAALYIPNDGSSINLLCGSSDSNASLFGEIAAMGIGGVLHFQ